MKDSKIIVTIFGADKIGIVAAIAQVMEKYGVNIDDISQTTMQEYFVMFMMCDIATSFENGSLGSEKRNIR